MPAAFRYSFPVLLGYLSIGIAFGLLLTQAGYPIWLALAMSVFIYAGAAQYIAVGLFAAGAGLLECFLVTLVVNARHLAYALSLMQRYRSAGRARPYLVFALTDETFALLSALPAEGAWPVARSQRGRFMFLVSILDQSYWVAGTAIGAAVGALLPFELAGLDFALTALFTVLLVEQILARKRPAPFAIGAACAVLATVFVPARGSLLAAMAAALVLVGVFDRPEPPAAPGGGEGGAPC